MAVIGVTGTESSGAASEGAKAPDPALPRPAVALLLAVIVFGLVVRCLIVSQGVFADELSTYWLSADHGLHGLISLLYGSAAIKHAEITPPISFLASWLTLKVAHTALWLRFPSLVAGALTIPGLYAVGRRTIGRPAALLAAALCAVSPFMIYYSTEARAYAVMMLALTVSTLALLLAADDGRRRWWILYAAASWVAFLSHYTCGFALLAQFVWVCGRRDLRRPAAMANLAVLAATIPWIPGLLNDFNSPTVDILSALSPFNLHVIPGILGHWAVGYPYVGYIGLSALPGPVGLALLAGAAVLAIPGALLAGRRWWRSLPAATLLPASTLLSRARAGHAPPPRILLIVLLLLATPVGEALASTVSTHIFGVRNLAASYPALVLGFAALLAAAGPRLWLLSGLLAIGGLTTGARLMLEPTAGRPDYGAAATLAARVNAEHGVVLDATGPLSPGPLTGLDVALHERFRPVRVFTPPERDHPFGFLDEDMSLATGVHQALAAAHGEPILFVGSETPLAAALPNHPRVTVPRLPRPYRIVRRWRFPGIAATYAVLYETALGKLP